MLQWLRYLRVLPLMITKETIEKARAITRFYGTSYYRATWFFPRALREATWILYAFVRIPDEMVDTEPDRAKGAAELARWSVDWEEIVEGRTPDGADPIMYATKSVHDQYGIPFEYSRAFLKSMAMDLTVERYQTYEALQEYMYGSAAAVGLMMTHLIGFQEGALLYAKALGDAMQLTNFLRDIDEDYVLRNRIYLPREEMDRFGVTEAHIANRCADDAWKSLMRFEVQRARALFREGDKGIALLHPRGRRAVAVASALYSAILDEIEARDYDIFTRRVRTSTLRKFSLITTTLWNTKKAH